MDTISLEPGQIYSIPGTGNAEITKQKEVTKAFEIIGLFTLTALNWQANTIIGAVSGCVFLYQTVNKIYEDK